MYFAAISPIQYLDRYSGRGYVQMCVAPWAAKYPKYFEWYKQRRLAGNFVFLDNGAYEGETLSFEEYSSLADELDPNVLTLPDKINDEAETARMAWEFMSFDAHAGRKHRTYMRVLQSASRDLNDWVELTYKAHRNYGWPWYALPRVLGSDFRPQVAACIMDIPLVKRIHAFGWTGSLGEIQRLARLGVKSMDSAGPVWRGLLGNNLEEFWIDTPFDPLGCKSAQVDLADNNLTEVLCACASM